MSGESGRKKESEEEGEEEKDGLPLRVSLVGDDMPRK
jgi:hypothetical protein